jgi:hypothetical protein
MRRISIAGLMAVVLVCGVAVAALREASDTWAGVLVFVTLGLLAFALLAIRQRREATRAFWEGFALFGWGYVTLAFGPWFADQVGSKLPTTQLLGYLHGKLNPAPAQLQAVFMPYINNVWGSATPPVAVNSGQPQVAVQPSQVPVFAEVDTALQPVPQVPAAPQFAWNINYVFAAGPGNLEHFQRVGQCLFALLVALAGGMVSRRLHRTRPAAGPATG